MSVCASCGAEIPPGFRFCGACGTPLTQPPDARETRKTVTVLFCDVAGSTALGERLDPESLRRVMRRYFAEMSAVVARHGGRVEKFIGDAVMAVFGLPRVHEDDALRAVRAAAEIRERLPSVAEEVGVTLTWRTGVNTGPVIAGSGQTLVVGDAVNVAARLEQAAPLGEILLGPDTLRLVRDAVEVEPVEPLALKGKGGRMPAYRLLRVHAHAPAFARRLDAPLVGRERELAALRAAFDAAVASRGCHVCTVVGPGGIGKSRLARAWLATLDGEATVVSGRCLHYGEGITFWPLVEVLMQLGDPVAHVLERIAQGGAGSPQELFWEVRKALEGVAAERPLVIVLDDLQWAEPMLFDLLEHLAMLSRAAPILLLCLARPELLEEQPAWSGRPDATTVLLSPLAADEAGALLGRLDAGLDDGLRDHVVRAAEGNPLFLEEMYAFVREGGGLGVPPTIQALLAARLEQLRDELRGVVECGAIEGEVFHRGAVVALAPETLQTGLDTHLGALVRHELIHPAPPVLPDDDAFRFRSLLIRDAAYEALPKQARADLHERFAGWLERRGGELLELHEIAGWHLEQAVRLRRDLGFPADAELASRAVGHLAAAGRRAEARTDLHAAVNLLSRARELVPPDDPERPRIALRIAQALVNMTAERAELEPVLAEAEAEPATRRHAAVLRLWAVFMGDAAVDLETARSQLHAAIDDFERAGDDDGLAKAHFAMFLLHWAMSQAALAEDSVAAAARHAARAGNEALLVQALGHRSGPLVFGADGLEETSRKLAEIEAAHPGPFVRATTTLVHGELHRRAGRYAEARAAAQRSADLFRELGFDLLYASAGQFASEIELDAGNAAEAVRMLRESLADLHALGDEHGFAPTTQAMLAQALFEAGELDDAVQNAVEAKRSSGPDDVINFVLADVVLALAGAVRGELDHAEELARAAVEQASHTDFVVSRAEARFALATVLAAADRRDEAREAATQALALYEQKGDRAPAGRVRRLIAELDASRA
jgi:class 3 adenylate cyclase/tetratricopeptide (TPR) repeat protein